MAAKKKKKVLEAFDFNEEQPATPRSNKFQLEFLNDAQKQAYEAYYNNDILFLVGPAGCGKTFLSIAMAIEELKKKQKAKIVLTRPLVEAGESLGFLPGDISEKVHPYMLPLYDSLDEICGLKGTQSREQIDRKIDLAPLGYLRGRTFKNSVCVLDEAQNCTRNQMKMFLTRLGRNSKMIICGDPCQSDLGRKSELMEIANALDGIPGIAVIQFPANQIVRHPLIEAILSRI
jgi:phosphate starvation-inducible PhoH-like protein